MRIFGAEFSEYVGVCKTPFLIYLAWAVGLVFLSFVFFSAYSIINAFSLPAYMALGLYVGWGASKQRMGGFQSAIAGVIFGFGMGIVFGLTWGFMITQNTSISAIFEPGINETIKSYGEPVTKQEILNFTAFWIVLLSPFFLAFAMAILSIVGSVAERYLGRKRTEEKFGEEKEQEEPTPVIRKKRPNKKFRKRK